MAHTIHVDIVSAEGQIFSGEATMVFVPGSQGELGIAPRHAPLLTTLKPGEVRVQSEGQEEQSFYVGGGALEIQPHLVTVLADTAARARDLDEAAALAAKQRAEDAVRERTDKVDIAEAQAELKALGVYAVPGLLKVLQDTQHPERHQSAIMAILSIGDTAVPQLLGALDTPDEAEGRLRRCPSVAKQLRQCHPRCAFGYCSLRQSPEAGN
jgi:F-type H+-transporting ATPase subunit epsilon